MSTWKCLYNALVCYWALTPPNGWLEVFIASPHNCRRWIEAASFCRRAHRTSTVHRLAPWPRQSTVGVCSSRPLDPTVARLSGAVARGRLVAGPSAQTVRWCKPDMLQFTVQCVTSVLADCPLHGFLCCFLGLLLFLSLGLISSIYVFF
jgi:hypothetical protein